MQFRMEEVAVRLACNRALEIVIQDLSGKIVLREDVTNSQKRIHIEHLSAGMYSVSIQMKGGRNV